MPSVASAWMDHRGRTALAGEAGGCVVKTRVQERARGGWHEAERPRRIAIIDRRDMVGEGRKVRMLRAESRPIGAEVEFPVLVRKAVEEVAGLETGPAIMPDAFLEPVG